MALEALLDNMARTMATYKCLECGKEKTVLAWRAKRLKFCSAKCAAIYNTKTGNNPTQFKKNAIPHNKGKSNVELYGEEKAVELKQISSETHIGNSYTKGSKRDPESNCKAVETRMKNGSYKRTKDQNIKLSCYLQGIDIEDWNGFISSERQKDWNSEENKKWRRDIFARDNYTCQDCGKYGGVLHAHHIKEWATHPDLRLDIDNGITLCPDCHYKEHTGKRAIRKLKKIV